MMIGLFVAQERSQVSILAIANHSWLNSKHGLIVHVFSTAQVRLKNVKIGNQVDTVVVLVPVPSSSLGNAISKSS